MSHGQLFENELQEIMRSGHCDLSNRGLTILPLEITLLTNLESLDIRGNELADLPPEVGQLTNLKKLYLDKNQLTVLPPEIGQLIKLEELMLEGNQLTELPSEISQLANLRELRLSDNSVTALPQEIVQLTNLESLVLDGNELTALPSGIGQLIKLRRLWFDNSQLTTLPAEVCQLLNLWTITFYHSQITAVPSEIGQLTNLKVLGASDNKLTQLPPELGQLANLETLWLDNNRLTELPPEIGQLTNLKKLVIINNQLTALPPEIAQLTNLETLLLDGNQLTELPLEITQLTGLKELTLTKNQLTVLSPGIADMLDRGLILRLDENPLADPLPELIRQGNDAIAIYLRSLRDGITQYEAKVLLLGEGNVGKTSLSAALRDEGFIEGRPFTHGIEIRPIVLRHPDAAEEMTIRLWDFGGQEVYRVTHQFFFSPRALYLVVWKPREGQEQNEVEGWLRRIRLRVGPDAQVLIVATHCAGDQYPELDYPQLQQEFPQMLVGHFEVDNQTGYGIQKLRDAIAEQAARLPQMAQKISSRWVAARDEILDLTKRQPQMSFEDFAALCRRHQLDDDETGTLAMLIHDLGQIVYYGADEGLRDFVILNPEWLTKAISYVLRDDVTRQSGGVLDHARLRDIWQDRRGGSGYPARYHRYFLRLMEKFDISYRLDDEQRSLVAQLVPYQRPELPWDSRTLLSNGLRHLALVCQLSEPAPGLMAWLTVRNHRATTGRHWRTGVFLRHPIPAYNSEALIELTASGRLAVEVRAPSPDLYFHVLSDSIETLIKSRWSGLTYQLLIPCPTVTPSGAQCPNLLPMEDLLAYREEGETRYLCARCRIRHDVSVLLTGFSVPTQALTAEIHQQLNRVEDSLIRLEDQAADTAAVIRRVLRVVSAEVTDCPSLFTLTQDRLAANKLGRLYQHQYLLTLWCSHPGYWHPWEPAAYQINPSKEWLIKIRPYATLIVRTLQLVVPLAGSIAVASLPTEQIEKAAAHLEIMKTIVDGLPDLPVKEQDDFDLHKVTDQMTAAQGDALRTLRVLIFEHDPMRKFGGLRRVQAPSGDFLWVCPDHYTDYDPGLPMVP